MAPGGRRVAAVLAASAALALASACGHSKHPAVPLPTTTSSPATLPRARSTTTTTPRHVPVCPLTACSPPTARCRNGPPWRSRSRTCQQRGPSGASTKRTSSSRSRSKAASPGSLPSTSARRPRIEPVRSGRFVDVQILQPLGNVLFAYSGAIQPVIDAIDSTSLLEDVGADRARAPTEGQHPPGTPQPRHFDGSALVGGGHLGYPEPPPPYFAYGPLPAGGTAAGAVHLCFPLDETTWTWGVKSGRLVQVLLRHRSRDPGRRRSDLRRQRGRAPGERVPHPLRRGRDRRPRERTHPDRERPAWVFRNGFELKGTWERPSLSQPATFVRPTGRQ